MSPSLTIPHLRVPVYGTVLSARTGQELRPDSREVFAALPASWSARQPLLVQVSQRPNKFSRFGEEWWAEWHGRSTLAVMHHDVSGLRERGWGLGLGAWGLAKVCSRPRVMRSNVWPPFTLRMASA